MSFLWVNTVLYQSNKSDATVSETGRCHIKFEAHFIRAVQTSRTAAAMVMKTNGFTSDESICICSYCKPKASIGVLGGTTQDFTRPEVVLVHFCRQDVALTASEKLSLPQHCQPNFSSLNEESRQRCQQLIMQSLCVFRQIQKECNRTGKDCFLKCMFHHCAEGTNKQSWPSYCGSNHWDTKLLVRKCFSSDAVEIISKQSVWSVHKKRSKALVHSCSESAAPQGHSGGAFGLSEQLHWVDAEVLGSKEGTHLPETRHSLQPKLGWADTQNLAWLLVCAEPDQETWTASNHASRHVVDVSWWRPSSRATLHVWEWQRCRQTLVSENPPM